MRKIQFVNNQYYHICNRGVERRNIFLDEEDFERFIFHIFECNDVRLLTNEPFQKRKEKIIHTGHSVSQLLVDIISWCLMPNHFHLLVKQLAENGIKSLMHRITMTYAKGFNHKYERTGALFQGPFVAKLIDRNEYLRQVIAYILVNPLEMFDKNWKEKGVKNLKEAVRFLKYYKYSGLQELIGKSVFPLLINQEELQNIVGDTKYIEKLIADFIDGYFDEINHLLLE